MHTIAATPAAPYYAVIFTSLAGALDHGYAETAARMEHLAAQQPGYLGMESAREGLGITVSYWDSTEAIANWKAQAEHLLAQQLGRDRWYECYKVRVALVERDYGFGDAGETGA